MDYSVSVKRPCLSIREKRSGSFIPVITFADRQVSCPFEPDDRALGSSLFVVFSDVRQHLALISTLVHTLDRVRSESPCLLSSMVAATSKFFRPDLHRTLMDHSLAIISRAVAAGACDTGLVQSLMIHVYWKAPTDRTAWMKLGMALRMAYQLRWHETQARQDGLEEVDLRRLLVSESTLCNGPSRS